MTRAFPPVLPRALPTAFPACGLVALCLVLCSGCGAPPSGAGGDDASPSSGDADAGSKEKASGASAREVLEAMVAAYQSASTYADAGTVRLLAKTGEEETEDSANFAVSFRRPDKVRMEVYQARVVCDGDRLRASIDDLPQQVLDLEAPDKLTLQAVFQDPILTDVVFGGRVGGPTQFMLLAGDDPMKEIMAGDAEMELLEPAEIDGRQCHRVLMKRREGQGIFWIDEASSALRRIEYPIEPRDEAAEAGPFRPISVIVDFVGARLGEDIDPTAFEYEVPPDARRVQYFVPDPRSAPVPGRLLGKAAPPFEYVGLSGNTVTPQKLRGKVVYLDFWAVGCQPCREALPQAQQVYERYRDNPKVAFFAVNLDPPGVDGRELEDLFAKLGVTIPVLRDPQGHSFRQLLVSEIPTGILIGPDGRVQEHSRASGGNLAADLAAKIEKLLAGEDICEAAVAAFEEQVRQFEEALKRAEAGEPPPGGLVAKQEIPRAEIAPRSEPQRLRLSPLWKCTDVKSPGNLLVVPKADGSPRILVLDGPKGVAELTADGKVAASHSLDLEDREVVTFLMSAVSGEGRRLFGGVAVGQQRVHVFDEQFKPVLHFPEDALDHPHPGVYDAQLADLRGDGRLGLYVSYFGPVGVQGVSLEGRRQWSFRKVTNVARLAVGGPDAQGRRLLWCAHDRGSLVGLDADGTVRGETGLTNRPLYAAFARDLTGDGQPQWCGLSVLQLGRVLVVGFSLQGQELWTYPMPEGFPETMVEPVASGRLLGSGAGQWILPGADGSIHVLAPDGKLIDRFNYGSPLNGLATATLGGKPALLVATPQAVEAWQVE